MTVFRNQRKHTTSSRRCGRMVLLLLACLFLSASAWAGDASDVCPRPEPASVVSQPAEIRSQNGRLELTLNFRIMADARGRARFCYMTDSGLQAPTLRVRPGDQIVIHLHNEFHGKSASTPKHSMPDAAGDCAGGRMSLAATNLHFHGLSLPPTCHQDDVMHTLVEPSATFDYRLTIPPDTSPGLYWYHPHPHPFSEMQILGGASGALIVEGIQDISPELATLPERLLVLRDQPLTMGIIPTADPRLPGWDISLNYVPVVYPQNLPAVIQAAPGRKEFWRVLNAGAGTIFDLQVMVNNSPQPLRLIAIDGVPLKTTGRLDSLSQTDVLLPPGARAEFLVTTPHSGDHAQLITRKWDTGPDGDKDPGRTIADIITATQSSSLSGNDRNQPPGQPGSRMDWRGETTEAALSSKPVSLIPALPSQPATERRLYFSETRNDPKNFGSTSFFLTVEGRKPAMFQMNAPPDIVVRQGTVEDWVIENRSREEHVFHIHQVHFQVVEQNGKPVHDPAMRDTIDVPYWSGQGPYPSVKLRMDFRSLEIIGTFMYHCHILQHSDNGMMGTVEVLPAASSTHGTP
jgi:FtsP/CotA-like multicopper oxidase with cupredoxin domain